MTNRLVPLALSTLPILALGCKGSGSTISPQTPITASPDAPVNPPAQVDAPSIQVLTPIHGRVGDMVTLEGTHLQGVTKVHFGGIEATDFHEMDGLIAVTVPAGARSGQVAVHCKGGRAGSRLPFLVDARPFDHAVDVVPFNLMQVKHWPGLNNTGSSCFLNAAIKVLATLREVDDSLRDHPGDDAALAGVRRQLRFTLNYIRLGDRRPSDAQDPMPGLIDAFQHHQELRKHVANTRGPGGFDDAVLNDMLKVLRLEKKFDITIKNRSTRDGASPIPTWREDHGFRPVVSSEQGFVGFDPAGHANLNAFISQGTTRTLDFDKLHSNNYPVKVPSTARIQLVHTAPNLALEFSPQVGLPLYQVDEANDTAKPIGTMGLVPMALTLRNQGHFWAAIRGADGWYVNDDARKPYKVDPSELNGLLDAQGNMVRETGVIFLWRTTLVKP